uniref:uncharacterized protein LOC100182225 isoform X2 n=1 Tax=Ciona intestinalis TaxID=7719 RepID=UPI000EF4E43B|nr:uncharacterized protein LOC100182225 isoform X2 [Ciona intestinalis]|eukprot:XP_026695192.1 uncharacterized protein LOC100182225 isoform X2 [Ciona intestinalis]
MEIVRTQIKYSLFYGLALGEILLGLVMIGIGVIHTAYINNFATDPQIAFYAIVIYYIAIGATLWCGIWISLHMGFAVVSAISAPMLCWVSVILLVLSIHSAFFLAFFTTSVLISFAAFAFSVISACNSHSIITSISISTTSNEYSHDILDNYSDTKSMISSIAA